jgi:hypothetical protein
MKNIKYKLAIAAITAPAFLATLFAIITEVSKHF